MKTDYKDIQQAAPESSSSSPVKTASLELEYLALLAIFMELKLEELLTKTEAKWDDRITNHLNHYLEKMYA